MKILILANNDVGLYRFRRELIEKMQTEHEVVLSLPYGSLVDPLVENGCKFIDTPVDRRGINPVTDLKLLARYFKIIRQEKPELVVTYTIKPNIYGGLICRLLKKRYAVNITGLGTAFQKEGLLKKAVTWMYRIGLKKADTIFFENTGNESVFRENGIINGQNICVLNGAGVNLEYYSVMDYPKEEPVRFLFIGRVMREKGILELLEAMDRLHADGCNCELDVVGPYEEDLGEVVRRYGEQSHIRFCGYQEDVKPYIRQTHCFVLPSWHEGMANTNLECAASGRPVITSNIPGCMEAVEDGVSGFLCEKQNAEKLYETMKRFIGLTMAEKEKMGLMGRKRMEHLFDKNEIVKKTVDCLMRI